MRYLSLFLKGFLIGIAKIMPGVSGAMLSISFGVYERVVTVVGNPFKAKLNDLKFLFILLLGAGCGIVLLCDVIKYLLNNYYLLTVCFFLGLIIGGLPSIFNEINESKFNFFDILIFIFSFLFVVFIISLEGGKSSNSNHYFMMGVIESLTTIIPGISGTAIFMALGWYETVLETIKSVLTFNSSFHVAFYFLSGFIISTILISKFLSFSLKKYKKQSYMCTLGFMFASLFEMGLKLLPYLNPNNLFIGIFTVALGYYITCKLDIFFSNY